MGIIKLGLEVRQRKEWAKMKVCRRARTSHVTHSYTDANTVSRQCGFTN